MLSRYWAGSPTGLPVEQQVLGEYSLFLAVAAEKQLYYFHRAPDSIWQREAHASITFPDYPE